MAWCRKPILAYCSFDLVNTNHMTCNTPPECFISAWHSYLHSAKICLTSKCLRWAPRILRRFKHKNWRTIWYRNEQQKMVNWYNKSLFRDVVDKKQFRMKSDSTFLQHTKTFISSFSLNQCFLIFPYENAI